MVILDPQAISRKLRYAAIGLGSPSVGSHTSPDERVWRNPALAVNAIVEAKKRVLLVKRRVEHALAREVKEECGFDVLSSGLVGVYLDLHRHPWKHVVTLCYTARISIGKVNVGAEEVATRFFPVREIPRKLAFDHAWMLRDYFVRRSK